MRWIFILFLMAEVYLAAWCLEFFGFWVTLLVYWVPTILGLPLVIFQNQMNWVQVQSKMASGKIPDAALLKLLLGFVGSVLMLVPSLVARVISIILLFPPTRFLMMSLFRGWIVRKISEGSFKAFSQGKGFAFGMGGRGFGADPSDFEGGSESRIEREARVIDIEAVKIPSTKVENVKKNSSDPN